MLFVWIACSFNDSNGVGPDAKSLNAGTWLEERTTPLNSSSYHSDGQSHLVLSPDDEPMVVYGTAYDNGSRRNSSIQITQRTSDLAEPPDNWAAADVWSDDVASDLATAQIDAAMSAGQPCVMLAYSSLAIQPGLHLYCGENIEPGSWVWEHRQLTEERVAWPNLVVDAGGGLHTAFQLKDTNTLVYQNPAGDRVVLGSSWGFGGVDLDVAPDGTAHLVYSAFTSRRYRTVLHAEISPAGQLVTTELLYERTDTSYQPSTGTPVAIDVAPDGSVAVAFVAVEDDSYQLSTKAAQGWSHQTVADRDGSRALVVDHDSYGRPHVAYAANRSLHIAVGVEDGWASEMVVNTQPRDSASLSLVLDSKDRPQVAVDGLYRYWLQRSAPMLGPPVEVEETEPQSGWDPEDVLDTADSGDSD